jgi:hypothetical protein
MERRKSLKNGFLSFWSNEEEPHIGLISLSIDQTSHERDQSILDQSNLRQKEVG